MKKLLLLALISISLMSCEKNKTPKTLHSTEFTTYEYVSNRSNQSGYSETNHKYETIKWKFTHNEIGLDTLYLNNKVHCVGEFEHYSSTTHKITYNNPSYTHLDNADKYTIYHYLSFSEEDTYKVYTKYTYDKRTTSYSYIAQ